MRTANQNNLLETIINNLDTKYKEFLISEKLMKQNFVKHITYIPKIIKCTEIKEVIKICEQYDLSDLLLEYKLDGILINITYYKGVLLSIVTKGNRNGGKDITASLSQHPQIPTNILEHELLEVRCEVVLSNDNYTKFYSKEFVDSRTTVSGQMNKKEIDKEFIQYTDIYAHDISIINRDKYNNQTDIYDYLNSMGFKTIDYKIIKLEDLNKALSAKADSLNLYNYMCDGCIIKINNIPLQIKLYTSNTKLCKYTIAFKTNQILYTKIIGISFIISKDANIIPILEIDKIICDDKSCTSISLYSYSTMLEEEIKVGDTIRVKYNTTFVYDGVVDRDQDVIFRPLETCFGCNQKLLLIGKKIYCINALCKDKNISVLYSYAKIKGIKSIGQATITLIINLGIIIYPIDIFDKNINFIIRTELIKQKTFGVKKINNIIEGLEYIQNNSSILDVIMLLGIPAIGTETIKKLTSDKTSLEALFSTEEVAINTINQLSYLNKLQKANIIGFFTQNKTILSTVNKLLKQYT